MVVCPRCAFPYTDGVYVISERGVKCSRCNWSGSSSDLLNVDEDKVVDPRVFDQFFTFLHKDVSPLIGRSLVQLGLVSSGTSPQELRHLAEILQEFSRAGLEAVVRKVLNPDGRREENRATVSTEG